MPCRMPNTSFIRPRAVDIANLREIGHRTAIKILLPPRIMALCGSQTIEVARVETLSFKGLRLLI
jgi:hypothetical protein